MTNENKFIFYKIEESANVKSTLFMHKICVKYIYNFYAGNNVLTDKIFVLWL